MEKVLEILEEIRPDVDFENEDSLVDGGVLDSFDIEIKPSDLVPANFNSAKAINALVEKLMDE